MRKFILTLFALSVSILSFAQGSPFVGNWDVDAAGLPIGGGKMKMEITYDGSAYHGNLDQDGNKVEFSKISVTDKTMQVSYTAMGFDVSMSFTIQDDRTATGSIMGMFDLKATKVEEE